MKRIALVVLAAIAGLVVVVLGVGYALPVEHVVTRQIALAQPPDRVFALLTAVEDYPRWRSDLKAVDVLGRTPLTRWREHGSHDDITFEMQESTPPSRLVVRVADPDLPFGGSWTYVLVASETGTRLTITEHGEVYNPVFRFLSRFVFGHAATLEQFLQDVERRLS
jgi:uncharacterized protein YndB with AHSA1/START domain